MKNKKKAITAIIIAVCVAAAAVAAVLIIPKAIRKPVNVYDIGNFVMNEYWGDMNEISGNVKMDKLQKVYVSETQNVTAVHVKEGDTVKQGDILVEFDTTLSNLDLEKAQLSVSELEVQISKANAELVEINNMQPFSQVLVVPDNSKIEFIPRETPMIVSGKGSEEDPIYVLYNKNEIDDSLVERLFVSALGEDAYEKDAPGETGGTQETESQGEGSTDEETTAEEETTSAGGGEPASKQLANGKVIYVAFVTRYENALNGEIISSWGLKMEVRSHKVVYSYYEPVLSESILAFEVIKDPYYEYYGSYTSAEIAQMRSEKEVEIARLNNQLQLAKVELKRVKAEVEDSTIYAKLDGVVKAVRDPDDARTEKTAVVEVSQGGGYLVQSYMSELDMLSVGQEVTVSSWETGEVHTGKVISVEDYPLDEGSYWFNGNQNVSAYPFTIEVDAEANLQEDSYVSVSYNKDGSEEAGFYIYSMFVITEDGKNYVYVQGEDGKLVKKNVRTGKSLWGSYIQIFDGISNEGYIAFPYGKNVEEGAKTVQADVSALYGGY